MAAGQYHTPVLFQRLTGTKDASGQPNRIHIDLFTDGARIDTIVGREAVDSGLETAESGIRVTLRFSNSSSTLRANDRMVIRGQNYNITYVQPNFDRKSVLVVGRVER